jgi:NhaP-type Na+/H+ or K+/H+ antiporter
MNDVLIVIGGVVAIYMLVAPRLSVTMVTGPIVFTAVGLLIGPKGFDLIDLSLDNGSVEALLTTTLAVVLFIDAAQVDVSALRRGWSAPARLLAVSFPVMLLLGFGAGYLIFDGMGLFAIAAIAVVLAPTDAALGQAVVSNPRVPLAVRQTLSVESGLNDGLALPVLLTVLAVAEAEGSTDPTQVLVDELVKEVGWGLVAGVGVAAIAIIVIRLAQRLSREPDGVAVSVAALGALAASAGLAQALHGSVLIAAFVAGLAFAPTLKSFGHSAFEFPENVVEILTLIAFVVFGGLMLSEELDSLDWKIALYAVLSLAVLRPIATAIGAFRSGAAVQTVGFIGWFGPRGLASILFVAIVVRKSPGFEHLDVVNSVMTWTVVLSVVAHGMTAWPGSNAYARWAEAHPDQIGEASEGVELSDDARDDG